MTKSFTVDHDCRRFKRLVGGYSLRDANHAVALQTIGNIREQLVTTDYVIDETLTLLRVRNENLRALAFGQRVIYTQTAKIVKLDDLCKCLGNL
jgi:predicted nucleic acid-binding protein